MPNPIEINWDHWEEQKKEGEGHIKFGVGVGAFGAVSLAVLGATCPLCFFVAPAMVGVGAVKRRRAVKQMRAAADHGRDGTSERQSGDSCWSDRCDDF